MVKVDYSARDRDVNAVLYILIQKKKGMSLDSFYSYWKNVHGPLSAQIPNQYQYWQFHLAHNNGAIWQVLNGTESKILEEDQWDGIAEVTFLSEQDLQKWIHAAVLLGDDEKNFVSKAIVYLTNNANSKTYIDSIEFGAPNGGLGIVKFHIMVKKANAVTVDDFWKYITDTFASNIVKSDLVIKFRLHLLEEHDNSLPSVPGVSQYEPLEKQYQAAFEIAFKNHTDLEKFFVSEEYAAAMKYQTKYIRQIAVFSEQDTYTFVYNGKLTLIDSFF